MTELERALRARRDVGGRCFVPYVTGGLPGVDADLLRGLEDAGADAIEVGIPFSDPVMDGGVVQEASRRALESGATPGTVLAMIAAADPGVPVAVMTYVNPVYHQGYDAFLEAAHGSGVAGAIVPDLPVDEASDWIRRCAGQDIASVFLAAPGATESRLRAIAKGSTGFVYCVATYGVTGARDTLEDTALGVVQALRPLTDVPLLVGVGIATPEQATQACGFADGVIIGSALMARMVDGDRHGCLELAARFRDAIPRSGEASALSADRISTA